MSKKIYVGIGIPLCLYSEDEIKDLLIEHIEDFGVTKGVEYLNSLFRMYDLDLDLEEFIEFIKKSL